MNLTDDEPTFTILVIDDQPDSMKRELNKIRRFLQTKELSLKTLFDEDGSKMESFLSTEVVDVVLIDSNIGGGIDGIDMMNRIRGIDELIDMIFYSAYEGEEENFEKARAYTFTEVVERDDMSDCLEQMVVRNLNKWSDVFLLRGIVISKIIDLELDVNKFFEGYFGIPSDKIDDFRDFVLENRYNSLEGKKQTLTKIINKQGLKNTTKQLRCHLDELQKDRNLLAHCKRHPTKPNCLQVMGEPEIFDKKRIDEILMKIKDARKGLVELLENINSAKTVTDS